ncbi:MAG: hypothetical protein ABI867_43695, partial [Kofleriaceae bacterium]
MATVDVSAQPAGDRRRDRDRDRDKDKDKDHKDHDKDKPGAYDGKGPRDAPPAARTERAPGRRKGFVWVSGNWDWKNNKWEWTNGRFEAQRVGRKFREPRWEKRNDVYVRIDSDWIDAGAPPALKEERFDPRPGSVFVRGHWDWDNGEWTWVAGRWERERAGQRWREDKWEQKNGDWTFVAGGWEAGGGPGPAPSGQYPTTAPPPPPNDRIPPLAADQVWIPGRHEWRNNRWEWKSGAIDRKRPGQRLQLGVWVKKNDRFEWTEPQWVAEAGPSSA